MWSTIYDFDFETNGSGTTGFTNVLWDANLTALGIACAKFPGQRAMWSGVSQGTNGESWGGCAPNVTQVFGEPYCGGPAGLWKGTDGTGDDWQIGADYWVTVIKDKPWVSGLWLGDEPELQVRIPLPVELSNLRRLSCVVSSSASTQVHNVSSCRGSRTRICAC